MINCHVPTQCHDVREPSVLSKNLKKIIYTRVTKFELKGIRTPKRDNQKIFYKHLPKLYLIYNQFWAFTKFLTTSKVKWLHVGFHSCR